MCQGLYAFALGVSVAAAHSAGMFTAHTAIATEARVAGGGFLEQLTTFGILGGLLISAAVAAAVEQLGARSWIRLISPLFLGYGVWGLIAGVPPLLTYAALEGEVSAAVAMISSIGFVLVGVAGVVLSLIERKEDPSLPEYP